MKIQIASDLHLDLLARRFPEERVVVPADADVLVIAGDIHGGTQAIERFADWPVPVVYVHGNHELYHGDYAEMVARLRRASAGSGVHHLECDELQLQGVRFLGCCLWTDYDFIEGMREEAMVEVERFLHDHRSIRSGNAFFRAEEALRIHRASRAWLEAKLAEPFDGPTVVVTHHAPHAGSLHPRYEGSLINAGFISDLSPLLGKQALWIHGHVHDSFDYTVNGTRVVANPRGYALNLKAAEGPGDIQWENKAFNPALVVGIA
jgi:Icc-related predicted phosphoesterase